MKEFINNWALFTKRHISKGSKKNIACYISALSPVSLANTIMTIHNYFKFRQIGGTFIIFYTILQVIKSWVP